MATFSNGKSNTLISGKSSNDLIDNYGKNVTIKGGKGNDRIWNEGDLVTISGEEGKDTISNGWYDKEISFGGSRVSINGGAGDDSIKNWEDNVTIDGGDGHDEINNGDFNELGGSNVSINGGAGNDYILNYGDNATVDGGAGNDFIIHSFIEDSGNNLNSSINGGSGNNEIWSGGMNNTINGGDGNDYIDNWGINNTVSGGKGDDTIWGNGYDAVGAGGTVYIYNDGDGNDIIYSLNETDTVLIASGTYSTTKSDDDIDIIIKVGKGNITLTGAAMFSAVNIVTSAKDIRPVNLIDNAVSNTLITGTSYIDSIENSGDSVTINGGKGNDFIENVDAKKVVFKYANGDGNDTIYGYNPSDTISLTSGSVTSHSISGGDLILYVGSGSIRIVGMKSANVNGKIYGEYSSVGTSDDDTIINYSSESTINALGGEDLIINGGLNASINMGDGYYNTVRNFGSNATIKANTGESYIHNYERAKIIGGEGDDYIINDGNNWWSWQRRNPQLRRINYDKWRCW